MKKAIYTALLAACVLLTACGGNDAAASAPPAAESQSPASAPAAAEGSEAPQTTDEEPVDTPAQGKDYLVEIEVQDYGTITVQLDGSAAPLSVDNFVKLANEGFYDGLTFHRVISGFMIQGGDPLGNGTGGSDEQIEGEFPRNGVDNPLGHTRGTISMARSNDYNSASSQFFIVHEDSPHLDGSYAAFGQVTDGIEIVDAICADTPVQDGNGTVAAADQPVITAVRVVG